MGLCINYSLTSTATSAGQAEQLVKQMRQLALDLPFEEVGEIISLEGDDCNADCQRGRVDDGVFWLLIQGQHYIDAPWNERSYQTVIPSRLIAFNIWPGPGSEPANIGLCAYPTEIECEYRPAHDTRFLEEHQPYGPGSAGWRFSQATWEQWLEENGHDPHLSSDDERFVESRLIKTDLPGWRWQSFTKTQYASDPACGGFANFLRCHISIITMLERIATLPTMQVEINDEGEYGPFRSADDVEEARAKGREPNFVWRKGHYDPKALVAEVGKWNGMVAAFAGAMKDALENAGMASYAPIQDFPDFEHLEFKGSQDEKLQPFLRQMQEWAKKLMKLEEGEED